MPKEISASQILKKLKENAKELSNASEDVEKPQIEPEEIAEAVTKSRPTSAQLKIWYSHIQKVDICVYVVETMDVRRCPRCDAWKRDEFEQKYIKLLHVLLGLEEKQVSVRIVNCDWNCITATTYKDEMGVERSYPIDIEEGSDADNYLVANGKEIEYFPALEIKVTSTLLKKFPEMTDTFIFPGIGEAVERVRRFKFNKKIFTLNSVFKETPVVRSIVRFLRHLDRNIVPEHEKVSPMMGQYFLHIRP